MDRKDYDAIVYELAKISAGVEVVKTLIGKMDLKKIPPVRTGLCTRLFCQGKYCAFWKTCDAKRKGKTAIDDYKIRQEA